MSRLGGARGTPPVVIPADGLVEFKNVQPGKYRVNYSWRASLRSVRLGAVEIPDHILDLSSGTGGAPVSVVFGPALAEVTGIVRDDKGPAVGAIVVLRNTALSLGSSNGMYTAPTGADGGYRFSNVPAGKYLLIPMDSGDSSPTSDNFEDYEDVSVDIEVGVSGRKVQDLKRRSLDRR